MYGRAPRPNARIHIRREARGKRRPDTVVSLIVGAWCPSVLMVEEL
jgi:hypothetical protein